MIYAFVKIHWDLLHIVLEILDCSLVHIRVHSEYIISLKNDCIFIFLTFAFVVELWNECLNVLEFQILSLASLEAETLYCIWRYIHWFTSYHVGIQVQDRCRLVPSVCLLRCHVWFQRTALLPFLLSLTGPSHSHTLYLVKDSSKPP